MKRAMLLFISGAGLCAAQGGFSGPGRYVILNVKSNKALEVARGAIVQNNRNGSRGQIWTIAPAGRGQLTIQSDMNRCTLTVGGQGNSVPVRCESFRQRPDQFWTLQPGRDGNALLIAQNGKALDIPYGTTNTGARLQTYDRNGDDNQRFYFQRAAGGPAPGPRPPAMGNIITCSSDDGRRRSCTADTSRGAIIAREFGRGRCIQGQTWGIDRSGIWVDRGCSADFRLGR